MFAKRVVLVFVCLPGVATYVCVAQQGYWDPQGPDLSNCTSPWVNHIMQKVSVTAGGGHCGYAALPLKHTLGRPLRIWTQGQFVLSVAHAWRHIGEDTGEDLDCVPNGTKQGSIWDAALL